MALQEESLDNIKPEDIKVKPEKSSVNLKILLIGIPIFITQLAVVYFITANILIKRFEGQIASANKKDVSGAAQTSSAQNKQVDLGKFIYSIDDIIVNPADTDGKRLLLTSVGFDLPKLEMENELKTREAMVKDAVISTLSSKDIVQLDNTAYRDTLKMEITGRLKISIPDVTINNVYFSKYILQ